MAKLYVNDNGTPKLLELESVGSVKTVNGVEPDSNGDVTIDLGVKSVNGTSFDGTADITTAYWGTARTLTIGSTGKSVDGSAAVSWALSEIGAAAASHTHSYLPLSGGTVSGNLTVTGTLKGATIQATSDKRLKTEIEEVHFDLSSIKSYRYKLKTDGAYHVGLIAQDVEKIIPEAVSEDDGGFKSLDYNAVVAALVDEVNTLRAEIRALREKLSC